MKVAILAGGLGTRLSEETTIKPKPMVEIGGRPMLWHIMNIYAAFGFKEFVIALGYKGEVIKDYFLNYHYRSRSVSVDLKSGKANLHDSNVDEIWTVHLLDTGIDTQTGGRIKQVAQFIGNAEPPSPRAAFVPVTVATQPAVPIEEGRIEIVLPGGRRVRVIGSVDKRMLADVRAVRAVREEDVAC